MAYCRRKSLEKSITWVDKTADHKNHNFCLEYVLHIVHDFPRSDVSYLQKEKYHHVLKCDKCNSFIAVSKEGNCTGFLKDLSNYQNLPVIIGHNVIKNRICELSELASVEVKK